MSIVSLTPYQEPSGGSMRELLTTTDPVLLSFVASLLKGEGINAVVFDNNISMMEGSIGAFPQRLVVSEDAFWSARRVLLDAGLGGYLSDQTGD